MQYDRTSDSLGRPSGSLSRSIARDLLGETRGRSVSRILADSHETTVQKVHLVLATAAILGSVYFLSKR